ncbi:MAG TPA: hydrogenase maturation nickel metallochaperone HypA [Anaerolineae bacterium]|jgi:hydrogenase nickel incorporation protein HypA/HybF|nr:hydrogenase maturation nickel metallochaperone HypA [Anaerolineae bacterium]
MHEAGVTERILEVVLAHAKEAHARRVTDVYLDVGEESGIDTESVELHWPMLSEGSVAEGAALHFNTATQEPFSFRLTSIEVDEPDE